MSARTWRRTGVIALVGGLLAVGMATPASAAPGDARAQALDIGLAATITVPAVPNPIPGFPPLVPALTVPVLAASVDLATSTAPPGGTAGVVDLGLGLPGLLGVAASDGTLTATSQSDQGTSSASSGVEDLVLSVLGLPVRATALRGSVACPANGLPTADTVVTGLNVLGTTLSGTAAATVTAPVTVAGLPTASLTATVTPATRTTTATTASATALTVALRVNVLGLASVDAGTIVVGAASCEKPAPVLPSATSLSPSSGPDQGGTIVTVTGSGFFPGLTSVVVGSTPVPASAVTVLSPTTLTFATPGGAAGPTTVSVVNTPGGTATPALPFSYLPDPTVTGVSPASGPVAGGTPVTVTGTGFLAGATSVRIGTDTVPAGAVTVTGTTRLDFVAPGDPAGLVQVVVTAPGGDSAPAGFTYLAPPVPTVTAVSPATGPVAGGTAVTLTGTDFVPGATSVAIGTDTVPAAGVTVLSATQLTFTTPGDPAGLVQVTATTPAGTSAPVGFTYQAPAVPLAPTVTDIDPAAGSVLGATLVTLDGTGFLPGSTVTIDGLPGLLPTVVSATRLTFLTPPGLPGLVDVTVTTAAGTSAPIGFTYLPLVPAPGPTLTAIDPASGSTAGGTTVTLTGTGFDLSTTVSVDGVPVLPTSIAPTTVTFSAPAHAAGLVPVRVTSGTGTSGPLGYTYLAPPAPVPPTAASLSPVSGPLAGNTSVTVTGTGFVPGATTVVVDGTTVTPTAVTTTSLTFATPAHAAGLVQVTVTTSPGGTSGPLGFTYLPPPAPPAPAATSLTPVSGPVAGGTAVTVTGTGFVPGATTVSVDAGAPITPTVVTATSLTFPTPAHAAGLVGVTVSAPTGTSAPLGFSYLAPPAPAAPTATGLTPQTGPAAGGQTVTLTGTDLVTGQTSVLIGGVTVPAGAVTVSGGTSATFTTPAHAPGLVDVRVATPSGTSGPLGYTYLAAPVPGAPTVTSISPALGPVAGGTLVTVTGTGFVPGATTVTVGGTVVPAADVTVLSATRLTFVTPNGVTGLTDVVVSTPAGAAPALGFTYVAAGGPTAAPPTPPAGPGPALSAAPARSGGALASTGVDTAVPLVGGALALLVGTGLLVAVRRRRAAG